MGVSLDHTRRRWLAGLSVFVLLGVLVGGWLWFRKTETSWQRVPLPAGASEALRDGFRRGALTSASCRECHADIFAAWKTSHHAHANRPLSADADRAAFVPDHTLHSGGLTTVMDWVSRRATMTTPVADGTTKVFHPDMVLAYTPLQQFLVPFGSGRWQVTEWAWDPKHKDWFNVYGDDGRQPNEWGSWAGRGMNWNSNCAACHMTGYEKNYSLADDAYASRWDEMGVSCLQCHAVTSDHLSDPTAPMPRVASPPTLAQQNCAACHSRRQEFFPGFHPGADYSDHFRLALPDREGLYYADSQVRDEDFEYSSFLMSKMGGHGGITCLDCHNPHSGATKLPVANNATCLACHESPGQRGAPVILPTAHSHHAADSTGNRCIECHMPLTIYMQRDPRRDHSFGIPDPLMTKELGIPNACNACHTDQSVDWAIQATDSWFGDKMDRPERERTRVVAQAYGGQNDSALMKELLRLADREVLPIWRATLLSLASRRVDLPAVRARLLGGLTDPNPLVRTASVDGLAPLPAAARTALNALLSDPVRLVRLRAAWAERETLPVTSPVLRELVESLKFNADQPWGAALMGQWYFARGESAQAEAWYRKAITWDRFSLPLYSDLARMQNAAGHPRVAVATLNEGLVVAPTAPDLLAMKGLLLAELGDPAGALAAFQKSLAAEPNQARVWYNLGLLHAQREELALAVKALQRAVDLDPSLPDASFALATIYLRQNDLEAARSAAQKALLINPGFQPARNLLDKIAPRP